MLAIGGTGGAVAGSFITGKQIKNGTVTGADLKNRSITGADLARSARRPGATGSAGPQGSPGIAGAAGAEGARGPAGERGQRGYSAWDAIPSGQTTTGAVNIVTPGTEGFHLQSSGPLMNSRFLELPARTPVPLEVADVRFGQHAMVDPTGVDASCTGSGTKPTAPAGKVCIYVQGGVGATNLRGTTGTLADQTFGLLWQVAPHPQADFVSISGSWAYTAP